MKKFIRIYQTPLVLESETYLLLTETIDYKPYKCYFFKVPRSITHKQICDFEERYFTLCDN